jgi:signal transduction histidine kinase
MTSYLVQTQPDWDHRLQFYEDDDFLCRSVAQYIAEGLSANQPVIAIATSAHVDGVTRHLERRGIDVSTSIERSQLVLLDARLTLDRLLVNGMPDETRFSAVIGDLVRTLSGSPDVKTVRAYGEMVDVLWRDGDPAAALALEGLWNDLGRTHALSLLCSYAIDSVADPSLTILLGQACDAHARVLPAESYTRETDDQGRARQIGLLQQRARALELELEHRKELELALRRAEQELREADRRKDEFLATLAHELRNPLAPLQNAVHILRGLPPSGEQASFATEVIDRQVRHMTRLVDDLLDLSRITTGRLELRRSCIELGDVIRAAVETSRPVIESAGHELTVVPPSKPVYVDGDFTRLAQVVANLLNNAAKYTEPGGTISISVELQGNDAVVSVRDSGMGIPPDMLVRVFDIFTQVDRTHARAQGGLGIGLTLAKRLIERHGGSITAESAGVGQGSTFVIRLTAVEAPQSHDHDAATSPLPSPAARRVLVVDDNVDAAETMGMLLEFMGHEVRTVYDGVEAVAAAKATKPDVVLLDIGLPGLSGHEVARTIREQSWSERTLIIALSGWGQETDRLRSREAGFDLHLVKPVDQETLAQALASR